MKRTLRLPDNPTFVVFRNSALGNAIMDSPIFPWLRSQWNGAKIVAIFDPVSAELFKEEPSIDRIIVLPNKPSKAELFKLRPIIAALEPDVSIHLKTGVRYELLALFSGCRYRVGFKLKGSIQYLTHRVKRPSDSHARYFAQALAGVLKPDVELDEPRLTVSPEGMREAEKIMADSSLVLHPGGGTIGDGNWNHALFVEALTKLGQPALVIGSEREQEAFRKVCELPFVQYAGKTSIQATAGLIARSRYFIGNDSGPAHIAEALEKPAIIVYRDDEGNYRRWKPLNKTTLALFSNRPSAENIDSILAFNEE